jgi:cysteinyl-tRNA synthetase
MAVKLYNTKTHTVSEIIPLKEGRISMYACGPTVYDKTHIGHMRKYILDDILKRTLTLFGYKVTHVMNITDVGHLTGDTDESGEDKLEKGARKEGKTVWDIAKEYTEYFHDTMHMVNVIPPTLEVKATDHIVDMIALTETLIAKGYAYETKQAVYFDTAKDLTYGSFSGQKLSEKRMGARDEVIEDDEKRNPQDFSLWFKRIGKFEHHSMHWPSPWGDGFPGWHIECSAMAMKHLGETIDIHTGGIDHIPVHHENEIAQSECATGHTFVNHWVHYDFLTVNGEKMSKSKENFYTISDIKDNNIDPLAVRIMMMQTSYRKPLNFTWESLQASETTLKKIQAFVLNTKQGGTVIPSVVEACKDALADDLNTAKMLAVILPLLSNTEYAQEDIRATLIEVDSILGLNLNTLQQTAIPQHIIEMAEERILAKSEKDFEKSDRLREQIEKEGYTVLDTKDGYDIKKTA